MSGTFCISCDLRLQFLQKVPDTPVKFCKRFPTPLAWIVVGTSCAPGCLCGLLVAATVFAAACDETGTIKVHKLSFNGVKAVDESLLKKTLATQASSKLPWGKKRYLRPLAV